MDHYTEVTPVVVCSSLSAGRADAGGQHDGVTGVEDVLYCNTPGGPAGRGRLLPWSTPEGNPCYVLGDGSGYVSRVADEVERAQLEEAAELLDRAAGLFDGRRIAPVRLRLLAVRMAEALRDVHRIAVSRGARLPPPAYEADGEGDGEGGREGGRVGGGGAAPVAGA
ncbi:hypothetical protein [Streptomyces sp. HB2AG]|uniref:hypothetical protein n=1 Tax=Streptomyces sp. HB2AG TaxID=2983400 RepID=UPI002E7B2D22|nr:hypothetical protein [Streptomyces sp. HB2AG]